MIHMILLSNNNILFGGSILLQLNFVVIRLLWNINSAYYIDASKDIH